MSLQVWLPLNGTLLNKGLCTDAVIGGRATSSDASNVGVFLNGYMSDVRIYCVAFSEKDVKSLYNNKAYIDENNIIHGEIRG